MPPAFAEDVFIMACIAFPCYEPASTFVVTEIYMLTDVTFPVR